MSEPCNHDVEEMDFCFATRCYGREVRLESCPKCKVVLATITIHKNDTDKFSITQKGRDAPKDQEERKHWMDKINYHWKRFVSWVQSYDRLGDF